MKCPFEDLMSETKNNICSSKKYELPLKHATERFLDPNSDIFVLIIGGVLYQF
jgi:hypothetical protein